MVCSGGYEPHTVHTGKTNSGRVSYTYNAYPVPRAQEAEPNRCMRQLWPILLPDRVNNPYPWVNS